jgi:hypothetical protein|tara:strand:+ start:14671 stop:15492 length:822 start_codon:yes stop_codon:yes gene_type:complete
MITVNASALKRLLCLTQRRQTVAGKNNPQVVACVLRAKDQRLSTTSLVRDGKTSVSHFHIPCEHEGLNLDGMPVPDIDRLLGVLKHHSGDVSISTSKSGIVVKSAKKQTTLQANLNGLAFPHSTETIGAWEGKSISLAEKIDNNTYKLADGSVIKPMCSITINAEELTDALSADNMNNQKLNRYKFHMGGELTDSYVHVGDPLKGQTIIKLVEELKHDCDEWDWSFEGGLENVVSFLSGELILSFLDFRPYEQGIRMILTSDNGWFMQAGVLE